MAERGQQERGTDLEPSLLMHVGVYRACGCYYGSQHTCCACVPIAVYLSLSIYHLSFSIYIYLSLPIVHLSMWIRERLKKDRGEKGMTIIEDREGGGDRMRGYMHACMQVLILNFPCMRLFLS